MTHQDLVRTFGRIGLLSFGGPAAQIALMHRILVDEKQWMGEEDYLRAMSFCMLLPGPEAMQLATYAGWRKGGIAGGLIAGTLFVLPGALVIFGLASAYVAWGGLPLVQALFYGIKACVAVIVVEALIRVAKRALKQPLQRVIAVAAFVGLFLFGLPFPLVILAAGLIGATTLATASVSAPRPRADGRTIPALLWGGGLWGAPLALLWLTGQTFLLQIGLFFSKLALVTFGGAYAVLAYMSQEVVEDRAWLTLPQMIDALGLAETTPGPLILVTQFVAYLAGAAQGGVPMAIAAALLTVWVTFVPCFLWIFAFAPHIEAITARPRLQAALAGISAAVVGVIGSLALWFALHVLFADVATLSLGPATLPLPEPDSLRPFAALIMALSAWLLLVRHLPLGLVLALAAALGLVRLALPEWA